ncbi:hypothetical protein ACHQM5_000037 [Ranunculus cassubicifolius]
MEEEVQPSRRRFNSSASSPAIRFLGFLNQPDSDSDSNPFELDESDVIWSPDLQDSLNLDSIDSNSPRLLSPTLSNISTNSNSPGANGGHHSFRSEKFGLSAALSDDHKPFVQRNGLPSLNQGLGLSAAKMIPALMSNPRSGGSSYDDSYKGKFHQSAPVNVPVWRKMNNGRDTEEERLGYFEEEDEETEEEMLPPHEIVARSHTTTFSVFEGVGRTLKGRDLRRVRNAVWQKTGFLD